MKNSTLFFLLTFTAVVGQSPKETQMLGNLIQKWELLQFEESKRNGNVITIIQTKYADVVSFEFKENKTLEVIYSDSKMETYFWKYQRESIEITPELTNLFNPDIVGVFEIHFHDNIKQLFLQRKNNPHNGIALKKS